MRPAVPYSPNAAVVEISIEREAALASVKELKQEVKHWKRRAESALGEVDVLRRRLEEIGGPLFLPAEEGVPEGKRAGKVKKAGKTAGK